MNSDTIRRSFKEARSQYHEKLLQTVLSINENGIPSNADKDSQLSIRIARGITDVLDTQVRDRLAGQTSGSQFEAVTADFLEGTFLNLAHIRPGHWTIKRFSS